MVGKCSKGSSTTMLEGAEMRVTKAGKKASNTAVKKATKGGKKASGK